MSNPEKAALNGSDSGNMSSDFRSTDAAFDSKRILPEAKEGIVSSGNAGTQGQTGASATRTTRGQAGEGTEDHYKK